ncbi:uncharacterized protein N7459_004990 [Penicillium hispanicum]|uniref:uncharacterized protein n=1 Tax=Penicillium hispanicum TaxID=1080232 RepID=UPI0025402FF7|nr:uncharacterized protein N7459_004990 [Penicillium hispanicum]KAJ5585190.1 hypothetical protein N7459_004990 [Penicillium hispanicum]
MPRTTTKHLAALERPNHVTYTLPSSPSSPVVTISIPPNSSWTSGPHWHETHTEYLRVIQGTAKVALSGHTRIVRPSDGIIVIPKFAVHEWSRVDPAGSGGEVFDAEETLVVEEWTDPTDGLKNVFFRNLNGVILDETQGGKSPPRSEWWLTLQLWVIFHGLDNWPVVVDGPLWLRWIITHLILRLGVFVGKLWHLQAIYPEYTPDGLIPGGPKVNKGD